MPMIDMQIGPRARRTAFASLAAAALSFAPAMAQTPTPPPASMAPARPAQVPGAPAAQAAPGQGPAAAQPQTSAAAGATEANTETVEQRIKELHDALKITPAQETKWKAVANAMRQNAAAMDKLMGETQAMDQSKITALQDLQIYTKFAQAHVAGLKNLTDDFRALYTSMPGDQKKVADQVFKSAGE